MRFQAFDKSVALGSSLVVLVLMRSLGSHRHERTFRDIVAVVIDFFKVKLNRVV